jgi:hypothetical protein
MIHAIRIRRLTRQMREATLRANAIKGDRVFSRRDRSDLEAWLTAMY